MSVILFLRPEHLLLEGLLTLTIVILISMIYLKTKEFYDLSKHKGIGIFRNSFFFFSLAYLFRFFFYLLQLSLLPLGLGFTRGIIGLTSLLIFSFFSTLAILTLAYSTVWKELNIPNFSKYSAIGSAIATLLALFSNSLELLILTQFSLLLLTVIFSKYRANLKKRTSNLWMIYGAIFLSWFLQLFSTSRLFPFEFRISLSLISISLYLLIYYKVHKWTR